MPARFTTAAITPAGDAQYITALDALRQIRELEGVIDPSETATIPHNRLSRPRQLVRMHHDTCVNRGNFGYP